MAACLTKLVTPAVEACARMRGAESVVDVKAIAQLASDSAKLGIVRFLAGVEAQIFQQCDIALLHIRDDFLRISPDAIVAERDRMIDQVV
jgi:hypothetical protein